MMKKGTIKIIYFILLLFMIVSCSKKLIPGLKAGREYDVSAYNYLYVDALRMKLLGNYSEALKYFEQCLVINPESDASWYQMAQIVINNGNLDTGRKYLIKACNLQPQNLWYNIMLAGLYHQQNNLDSAIICYERAAKTYPEREDIQLTLAKLYTQSGNYGKAGNILGRIDEQYGTNETTTLSLVENLMAEGKYKEAHKKLQQLLELSPDDIVFNGYLAALYRAEGNHAEAKRVYQNLIERNPNNPVIQLSLCDFLMSEKEYEELFMLLKNVILNSGVRKEDIVSFFAEMIENENIIKEHKDEMIISLMVLEAAYKNDDLIVLLRPEFLDNVGGKQDAAAKLEEIVKENPDNYYAWEKLLMLYYDLKDYQNLQKKGEETATRFNRSVIAKMLFATGATENGDYQTALEELRKADILAGDNQELKLQIITMRADINYRMKNYNDAFRGFDEALKIKNDDLTVLNNYAYYLAEQNMQLKYAEEMAKTVIGREKDNNTFLDTYAWVLYKRGKVKEASRIMEKIIQSAGGNDAEYMEHYGYIKRKMGKCGEAVGYWEKAITADPTKSSYLYKEIESCKK